MKILISILGLLNGVFMLIDGIHVMLKGKYIGPPKPGPWANLFYRMGMDVFKLGPLFIVFGILWFIFLYGMWTNQQWSFAFGIVVSVFTLWYLPVGTLISLIVLIVLMIARQQFR